MDVLKRMQTLDLFQGIPVEKLKALLPDPCADERGQAGNEPTGTDGHTARTGQDSGSNAGSPLSGDQKNEQRRDAGCGWPVDPDSGSGGASRTGGRGLIDHRTAMLDG